MHWQKMSLGSGAIKSWWGPGKIQGTAGKFHDNPVSRNLPCKQLPTSTVTKGTSVEILKYLTRHLPWPESYDR